MVITKILANNISPKDKGVCGEFSVVFDNALCVHKILVVKGEKGLFITFPNGGRVKSVDNIKRYEDVVHPTNNDLRQYIQKEILKYYEDELSKIH